MTNNGTYSYTATANGEYTFDWLVLNGGDSNKDSSLALTNANFTLSGNSTVYSAPIALTSLIHASLTDTDGSESLGITISGVPSGAAFTTGTHNNDGTWSFTESQLDNLYLLPADNYTGTLNLTVTAIATESDGSTASVSDSFNIVVSETSSTYTTATEGNDNITGTTNADLIRGYAGDDTINAGNGDDIVYGGAGNDTLNGGNGNDTLYGGVGNDRLDGGAGSDKLYGGAGNDTLVYDSADSKIDGGVGTDTLLFNAKTTIDFSTLDSTNDPIKNIEVLDLTQAKVTIQNLSLNDVLDMTEAGAGNIHTLTIQGANDDAVNVPVASGNYTVAKTNTGGFDVYTYSHTGDPTVVVKIDQDIQHS
jgi:Ca2+-binding RTX toxin-like protein